jgi:hypothetical protein
MRKVLALSLTILLALASVVGYLSLHAKIIAGEKLIADGQAQFDREQINLDEGKVKLEAGKHKAADGKRRYEKARGNRFLVLADKLFKGGKGFRDAREQIADGDKRVAKGEDKVSAGQGRLDVGEAKLLQGRKLLRQAKSARVACALGAAFFGSLSIVLGIRWRRSLARTLKRADT